MVLQSMLTSIGPCKIGSIYLFIYAFTPTATPPFSYELIFRSFGFEGNTAGKICIKYSRQFGNWFLGVMRNQDHFDTNPSGVLF